MSKYLRAIAAFAVVAGSAGLTGCASIVSGTNQIVSVETLHATSKVDGATCKLENDKGVYYVTTPGTVTVRRAYGDMSVRCEKPGMEAGIASIKSSTKGMAFGNVVFGGVIGVGVDMASGAAYDYPNLFQVMMGQTTTIAPGAIASTTQVSADAPAQAAAGGSD
jgi:hypothetical protein